MTAQKALQSCQQNGQFKWLCQVIVRARRKSLEYVFWPAPRRQHENRHEVPRRPQICRNCKAVFAGQHDVKNNSIETFGFGKQKVKGRLAVRCNLRRMPFLLQIKLQASGNVRLVLNDKNTAHETLRGSSRMTVAPL